MVSSTNSNDTLYHLLIVDDDSIIRDNLREYLSNYHMAPYDLTIDEASTAEDALEKIKNKAYDLLICDINLPDRDGFYIVKEAANYQKEMKKAMITAYDLDSYINMAKDQHVHNIIIKTAPFNFSEFSTVVDNLLAPQNAFGLEKYIDFKEPPVEIILKSSKDIMPAQQELKEFFNRFMVHDIDALSIVMVEAITNAVYHSAKNSDGSLRYKKGEVVESLSADEAVTIQYGYNDEKLGVSIRDQGGSVTADEVLYWLERNITGKSLMDTHGRGLYLIYRLMDRMVINLERDKSTELVLIHYFQKLQQENKPIYINETVC